MNRRLLFSTRWLALMATVSACLAIASRAAADSQRVVSVEEHWELRVSEPDFERSAPQTTMVMSPTPDLEGTHFLLTLNHATVPGYAAGGIQAQLWNGDEFADAQTVEEGEILEHGQ